jgi:hypothetical protein
VTVIYPEATAQLGNTSITVAQVVADMAAPKLATEINAVTSANVSCFLYSGGVGTSTTNKGSAPRRVCTKAELQQFGITNYEVTDLSYVYDPQAADSTNDNKAKAALTEGSEVYLIVRKGLDAQSAPYSAGQYVDVWHVELGPQNRTTTGDGEFDEYSLTQSVIVKSPPQYDVLIVT